MTDELTERVARLLADDFAQALADYDVPPDVVRNDVDFQQSMGDLATAAIAAVREAEADELDRLRAALARTEANRDAAMQDAAEEHERAEKAKAEIDQLREALQVAEAFISIAVPERAKDMDEAVDVVLPKIRAALQETDR